MMGALLQPEERESLQAFVDRSLPDAAYLRRVKILLLADDEQPHEAIAAQLNVPILHVRHFLRAFYRQGLGLFPAAVLEDPFAFTADDPADEASRKIMAALVADLMPHKGPLGSQTDRVSVHETRKGIRKLRTAFSLFEPHFEEGLLKRYRKQFRKVMRRLAHARDLAVFLLKLDAYMASAEAGPGITPTELQALQALAEYWRQQLEETKQGVRQYMARDKVEELLADFQAFTGAPGRGSRPEEGAVAVGQVAPGHIRKAVDGLLACGDGVQEASVERLHRLRILAKELRHTLEFYLPIIGPEAVEATETVKALLERLGDLNDAHVHLALLDTLDAPDLSAGVEAYRRVVTAELDRLMGGLADVWEPLAGPGWQGQIEQAVSALQPVRPTGER
jgi:CHAD domain-containing protein